MELEYIVSLLASGLSFNQVSIVVDYNRQVIGKAAKQKALSDGEASCTSGIVCVAALRSMADLVRSARAFRSLLMHRLTSLAMPTLVLEFASRLLLCPTELDRYCILTV